MKYLNWIKFIFIIFFGQSIYAQTKENPTQIYWIYTLPNSQEIGPMDVRITFEYYFWKENFGDDYFLGLTIKAKDLKVMINNGTYRFKYNNKIYRQDEMVNHDHLPPDNFKNINITDIDIDFSVNGHTPIIVKYSSNNETYVQLCKIPQDRPTSNYNLDFVTSRATKIYFDNHFDLIDRINNLEKELTNKNKYDEFLKNADQFLKEENLTKATASYNEALKLFPTEKYPKDQIEKIKIKQNSTTESNTTSKKKEQLTNNNAEEKNTTVKTEYENSTNNIEPKKASADWTKEQADAYLDKKAAEYDAKVNEIKKQGDALQNKINNGFQSYYAAKAVENAKANLNDNSSLDANYASVEELEADFNRKYAAISSNIATLTEAQNNSLQSGYNYYFNDADASGQAIGQVAVGIGSMINQAEAEKKAKEAKEQLKAQRERQLEIIEESKKSAKLELRNNLLSKFQDGGMPKTFNKIDSNELYFFSYTYDKLQLSDPNPVISVSNVFQIYKYGDGSWPFKDVIVKEIMKIQKNNSITLLGYYIKKEFAEEMRQSFIKNAKKCEIVTVDFVYKGKIKTDPNSQSNIDFWGNPIKTLAPIKDNKNPNEQNEDLKKEVKYDYWGNPIKTSQPIEDNKNTNEQKKEPKKEVKYDYWGNPKK